MAITIVNRPNLFTPAGSPIVWQVSTDNEDILYFRAEVIDDETEATINTLDIFPTPDLVDGAFVDLSKLMANAVSHQLDNEITLVSPMLKPVRKYRLKITERALVSNVVTDGDSYDDEDDVNYVFNAMFDVISFNAFDDNDYVIKSSNPYAKFLTAKPQANNVNMASTEYLYFMQHGNDSLSVQIKEYDSTGTLVNTINEPITDMTTMYRLNVSPKMLKLVYSRTLTEGQYYTVQITSSSLAAKSEIRRYNFTKKDCMKELVNLHWVNSFGGVDSYQFINPQATMNVNRTNIEKNPFTLKDGIYSNIHDNIYNTSREVIERKPSNRVAVWSEILTNSEVDWLGELVASKQVYVELTDGKLVPVMLGNTSYKYQRQRYLQGQVNVMQFDFEFGDNYMPMLSNGSVSFILSTSYQNVERSWSFQKQGCSSPSQVGTWVVYTVPAGTYTSDISQAHANELADDDINLNGQDYADANGSCDDAPMYGNTEQSGTFYSTACSVGNSPAPYLYVVPADTYFGYSQSAANALAFADVVDNGQAEADANGTCSPSVGNEEQSETFFSQNCAPGEEPDAYVYTVPADTYFSTSLAAANMLAWDDINANGQDAANTINGCTVPTVPTIALWISYRTEDAGGGYDDLYYTVFSNGPMTDNVTVNISAVINMMANTVPPVYMYTGNYGSSEVYAGQFPVSGGSNTYNITIASVSPNPDGAGTTYTY